MIAHQRTTGTWRFTRLPTRGLALQEIAQRLRRPRGEVELILALRPTPLRVKARDG